jgi:ABC-type microcin C transport system permease subunit YejB
METKMDKAVSIIEKVFDFLWYVGLPLLAAISVVAALICIAIR